MADISLRQLLYEHLSEFREHDAKNARKVKAGLKKCPRELDNDELILWWKQQEITIIASLQSYMFWMWTAKHIIEYSVFETAYETLTPMVAKSWNMPIEITTGLDSPLHEGGFLSKEFSIFHYKFSPSNHDLVVESQEFPPPSAIVSLDLILDFLSFALDKYDFGYLGFRQKQTRKWKFSKRSVIEGGLGPEVRQDMLDFDFKQIETALTRISADEEKYAGLSLIELLRIRHRAILDSTRESKLITLWSGIEAMWGEESKDDLLFTDQEMNEILKAIEFLPKEKIAKTIDKLHILKNKTKNDKIVDEVSKLECGQNIKGLNGKVRDIFAMRSKFAHGKPLREKDLDVVNHYITFLTQIFDELISKELTNIGIAFNKPG